MRLPLRLRLAAVYGAVLFFVIVSMGIGTYLSVRAAVHSIVDRELETRFAGVQDHLSRHAARFAWPELADSLRIHPTLQPALLRITDTEGNVLFEDGSMHGLPPLAFGRSASLETLDREHHRMRVLTTRGTILGKTYEFALATDLQIPGAILQRLWLVMLGLLPVVLFATSWAGYWISGRALRPVTQIINAARSIDSTRLHARVEVPNTGDEIQLLAETTNGMLQRIEDGFRHVRQFTADASHELRTPVAIIRAAAEVALLSPTSGALVHREALERILREAERDSRLLDDLLYLARADAGAENLEHRTLDLETIVRDVCGELLPLATANALALTIQVAAPGCRIEGNEDQLRRLWLVLLDNAVKYTPSGGSITIGIGVGADGHPFCEIKDSGIGIGPEHLSRIFERFYRADKARSRRQGGSGLGLAIAREITSLHGATIEVESLPDHGTHFRVVFPKREDHAFATAS